MFLQKSFLYQNNYVRFHISPEKYIQNPIANHTGNSLGIGSIKPSYKFGIVTTREAPKYFEECQNILQNGHFFDKKYLFYSVYILIHILFYKLGFETIGAYLFQLLLNLLATYLLFNLTHKITGNNAVAFIAVILLLLTHTFQMWTVFLYTESVFSSLVIIFSYCFLVLNQQDYRNWMLTSLVFLFLLFARPTGVILIPVLFVYFFILFVHHKEYLKAILFSASVSIVIILMLNYAVQRSNSFNFVQRFFESQIICDIPIQTITTIPATSNTLVSILEYIIHNKIEFLHLAGQRFISFWGMQRPYNSRAHDLFFACYFYPVYFLGLFGSSKLFKLHKRAFVFILSTLVCFTLSVVLTCDEWSNRFNVPIIPFVMILAAIGLYFSSKKITNNHLKSN